jgi:tetratricopeptide (TPR) repeat protein
MGESEGLRAASLASVLGSVHSESRDHALAVAAHRRALELRERLLGPDHPDVAISCNNLAIAFAGTGDHDAARRMHERALGIRRRVLGSSHPDVGTSHANLGDLYREQGMHESARDHYRKALAIQDSGLGPTHSRVAYTLSGLARSELALGRPDVALGHATRSLTIREGNGARATDLADSRLLLARIIVAIGDDLGQASELAEAARRDYVEAGDPAGASECAGVIAQARG